MTDGFRRYLRAKRTVDNRALDRRLLGKLREGLTEHDGTEPLSVLEIGAGIGTMVTRFLEWDILPAAEIRYTAVDIQQSNVDALPEQLRRWAGDCSVTVEDGDGTVMLSGPERRVVVEPVAADAVEHIRQEPTDCDLLVGAALLDIIDDVALPTLLSALDAGGLYYVPLTFDGGTRFRPSHPDDDAIERAYHEHMDTKPCGNSRAGSAVLARLHGLPGVSVDAAGSDWVVVPEDGAYPADEAYFLEYILDTVEQALGELDCGQQDTLDAWLAARREQLDAGELLYTTHQLDLFGRVTDPTALSG